MIPVPDDTLPPGTVHLLPGVAERALRELLEEIAIKRGLLIAPPARDPGGDDVTLSEELAEFFASCKDKIDWLLEPYVFDGGFTLVQGAPKCGKTWLVAWIAVCVALAGKKVLFVEEEGARETLRDRLKPFVRDPKALRGKLLVVFRKRIRLDQQKSLDSLIAEVRRTCARLLVLDPFIALHGRKEKDEDEMAIVLSAIQQIITETGCAVLLVHHTRKGDSWDKESSRDARSEDARGSGAIVGDVDHVIAIKALPRKKRKEGEVSLYVENPDTRVGAPFCKKLVSFRVDDGTMHEVEIVDGKNPEDNESLLSRILAVLPQEPQWQPIKALRQAMRVRQNVLVDAIGDGIQQGLIVQSVNKGVARPVSGASGPAYPNQSGTPGTPGTRTGIGRTPRVPTGTPGTPGTSDKNGISGSGATDPIQAVDRRFPIDPEDRK